MDISHYARFLYAPINPVKCIKRMFHGSIITRGPRSGEIERMEDDGMTPVLRGSLGNFVIIWRKHFAATAMAAAKKEAPNCRQRPWGGGGRETRQTAVQGRRVAEEIHRQKYRAQRKDGPRLRECCRQARAEVLQQVQISPNL